MSRDSAAPSTRRGPRPRFTREEVLRTALRIIDTGTPGSFSMRQLADELGVGVMTLYGYVRDKEELYEAVTALAFSEAPVEPATDGPWDEQIRTGVRELYGLCRRHPNLLAIALADTDPHPGLFRRRERIMTALRSAGFPPQTALHALGALTSYTLGFALAQGSALRQLPPAITDHHADFPSLSEAADDYPSHLDPAAFEYGLELLIRGLRADLAD